MTSALDNSSIHEKILAMAKDLKLYTFADYKEYMKNDLTKQEFLYNLLSTEASIKDQNRYRYRLKNAAFPIVKTLDTFEFDQDRLPELKKDTVMELATCEFIAKKQNVVAIGGSGTGKTHIITALGVEAIRKGYTVKFRRASELVTQMTEAANEKLLTRFLKNINACDALIIDELGYLSYDAAGASLLFQIFASRYETKSIMVTSNLEFSKWVTFLGKDEHMTSALIGRLVHQSTILNMNGENYRLQKRNKP
ncbi:IS21-like element helper ATPase IstB [Desulfitibacter alkalitolerans]|uniref:IS21-like element helper ATPase IstB n=1 Tax=Desulfitibacter alkalitolerans TaxID=264641 RepID=UPI0006866CD9|nr:IS21-like element helper ATPase IstB [Desulfitibacter alkalitolerans]